MIEDNKPEKGYAFMFTINNPRFIPDIQTCESMREHPDLFNIAYCAIGYENASMIDLKYKHMTPHYQGLIVFNRKTKWKEVKNLLPRAHIEDLWATLAQANAYCLKQNTWFKFGDYNLASSLVHPVKKSIGQGEVGGVNITPLSPQPIKPFKRPANMSLREARKLQHSSLVISPEVGPSETLNRAIEKGDEPFSDDPQLDLDVWELNLLNVQSTLD